jgi:YfiH family protein
VKFLHQTHSDKIWVVGRGFQNAYGDAMVTGEKGIDLAVKIADCAGILLYDPIKKVVAAVHSGWRGSSKRILPRTIEFMVKEFGTNPQDLLAYVSPLASGKRYEVGKEVAQLFPRSIHTNSDGRYFFDNRKEILFQFDEAGVSRSNIEISEFCTIETLDLHSYRREGEHSGRMAAFIGMRKI